ncbi:unnamed protein product [Mesocestoides corti]|uniref:Ion_trans_2 domain-containing protein n=1 Tax=Mesocestoides corti TaxID=53468 RepID=A0A0R3U550_MESCO|nr:unnamed protein product [Mesocestoides corti]
MSNATTVPLPSSPPPVTNLVPTEPPRPHWIFDCPSSTLAWWFPLALSGGIYLANIILLFVRHVWKRFTPRHESVNHAYPSIFGGVDQNPYTDTEHEFEFNDDDSAALRFQQKSSQWLEDSQLNVFYDYALTSPMVNFDLSTQLPMQTELNDVSDGKRSNAKESGTTGTQETTTSIAEETAGKHRGVTEKFKPLCRYHKTEGHHRLRLSECLTGGRGQIGLRIRIYCEKMTSVSYPTGRFMLVVYVLLCTISWVIYIIGTIYLYMIETLPEVIELLQGRPPLVIEGLCLTPGLKILNYSDLVIHSYFLVYFILRLGAAVEKHKFLFKITSIIDVITICGAFVAAFQPRYHLDLGFLRALNIFNFGEVLSYLGILSSNHVIQTVDIFFTMFAMWMLAGGLIHLIVHIGDFWKPDHKALSWSYLDCCYFLMVTMSTVGFGDFYPVTILGRLYICVFIPVAMGIFAVFVPEIFRNLSSRRAKTESYQALAGHQHVVVCGNFNNFSLNAVLRGFFHIEHASRRRLVNMVILRVSPIDLAMRAILTKYNAWVKYYQGTPADPQDLARICLRSSQGALVLATPNSSKSSDEDGANIMQAIALKAHSQRIRVLVQLHHFKNKCLLHNFPRWTCRNKDMVICMDELKLGLMALNCLAPGFSTIILNLLNGHRVKNQGKQMQREKWRQNYEYGVSMEIYDVSLSYEFHNLSAQELTLFAYEKWGIVLCALYCTEPEKPCIIINPAGYRDLSIDALTTKAIVIATNSTVVNRMRNYCTTCKAHITGATCQCPTRLQFFIQASGLKKEKERKFSDAESESRLAEDEEEQSVHFLNDGQDAQASPTAGSKTPASFDFEGGGGGGGGTESPVNCFTGGFTVGKSHNSKAETFSRFTVAPAQTLTSIKSGQLVRGLFRQHSTKSNSTDYFLPPHRLYNPKYVDSTGCFHWVPDIPIESVKLTPTEAMKYHFKEHYVLCIVGPLAGGSLNLKSFVMPLRFHWMEVRDIVILGDTSVITEEEWAKIKNIPHVFLVQGSPCSLNDLHAVRLKHCSACTILGESANEDQIDQCLRDKNTLFSAMTIRSLIEQSTPPIHMTTELHYEQNAHHFSSAESHHLDFKLPLRFQESFARGIIFSNTLLYSSISSLYFSGAVFRFLRVLLFGIAVEDLESVNLQRNGFQRGHPNSTTRTTGVRVALHKMCDPPFRTLFARPARRTLHYKDVFTHALMCWRILCLGIYRLDRRGFRVVITNPPRNLKICADDQVFCFIPSEFIAPIEDPQSPYSTCTTESNIFLTKTPYTTYAGMSAVELARQSASVMRNLQQP